jgi:hypothetical protein
MKRRILLAVIAVPIILTVGNADAKGVKPVTSGAVIRGVTLPPPASGTGTSTGKTCDFSGDPVDQHGRLEGSSVNCAPGGTLPQNLVGLPARFNAYCVITAPVKSARLIQSPIPGDDNHCDLSGITPKDATRQFKGAVWR